MSNTNSQPTEQNLPEWCDPFPEPNTMPRKWDLSQYGYMDEPAKSAKQTDNQDGQTA